MLHHRTQADAHPAAASVGHVSRSVITRAAATLSLLGVLLCAPAVFPGDAAQATDSESITLEVTVPARQTPPEPFPHEPAEQLPSGPTPGTAVAPPLAEGGSDGLVPALLAAAALVVGGAMVMLARGKTTRRDHA